MGKHLQMSIFEMKAEKPSFISRTSLFMCERVEEIIKCYLQQKKISIKHLILNSLKKIHELYPCYSFKKQQIFIEVSYYHNNSNNYKTNFTILQNFLRDLLKEAKKSQEVTEDQLIQYTDTLVRIFHLLLQKMKYGKNFIFVFLQQL